MKTADLTPGLKVAYKRWKYSEPEAVYVVATGVARRCGGWADMATQEKVLPDGSMEVTSIQYGLMEMTDEFGRKGQVVEGWNTTERGYAEREVAKSEGRWSIASRTVTTVISPWVEEG